MTRYDTFFRFTPPHVERSVRERRFGGKTKARWGSIGDVGPSPEPIFRGAKFSDQESWSEWPDLNLRPPRPERG
jgi:hypothetical protein